MDEREQTSQENVLAQAAGASRGGLGALTGAQTAVQPGGAIDQAVNRLKKCNARLSELVSIQRDQHCRLTGNNPLNQDPTTDKPRAEGSFHDLVLEMEIFEMSLEYLNQLTDAWGTL